MARINRVVRRPREIHEVMSARVSIRNFCLQCVGWENAFDGVKHCVVENCWLYKWRFGKTPEELKRLVSPETLARLQAFGKAKSAEGKSESPCSDDRKPKKAAG